MTEQEWAACTYLPTLLMLLDQTGGDVSPRKLRLFAGHCCRLSGVWRFLDGPARALVEAAERYAEGDGPREEVVRAAAKAPVGRVSGGSWRGHNPVRLSPSSQAQRATLALASDDAWTAAWVVASQGVNLLGADGCHLFRDVFGYLRCPVARHPAWGTWDGGAIPRLAQAIYGERAFDRLPVLADALEEAGCTDAALLAHCREPGEHVRGCWVLDLLLGRT